VKSLLSYSWWQLGASSCAQGRGVDANRYRPGTEAWEVWLSGWQSWSEYQARQAGAGMVSAHCSFAVMWFDDATKAWCWRLWAFEPGGGAQPLRVSPQRREDAVLLRVALLEHNVPVPAEAIAIVRTPDARKAQ
jgi:hypothetical protein